jgi:hypothetical protein
VWEVLEGEVAPAELVQLVQVDAAEGGDGAVLGGVDLPHRRAPVAGAAPRAGSADLLALGEGPKHVHQPIVPHDWFRTADERAPRRVSGPTAGRTVPRTGVRAPPIETLGGSGCDANVRTPRTLDAGGSIVVGGGIAETPYNVRRPKGGLPSGVAYNLPAIGSDRGTSGASLLEPGARDGPAVGGDGATSRGALAPRHGDPMGVERTVGAVNPGWPLLSAATGAWRRQRAAARTIRSHMKHLTVGSWSL